MIIVRSGDYNLEWKLAIYIKPCSTEAQGPLPTDEPARSEWEVDKI
jgi:hypothetical protein